MSSPPSSKRAKLEAHFASGKKGKDMLEGASEDPYDHTKMFYKNDQEGEQYAATVEVGVRKIKGEMMDLDDLVYRG